MVNMDDRAFSSETKEFEPAVIALLQEHGWEDQVLVHSSEADLIRNWADILFEKHKDIDRLNNYPIIISERVKIRPYLSARSAERRCPRRTGKIVPGIHKRIYNQV